MHRVAVVQAEPVWIDAEGTLDKTLTLMEHAAREGARVVVFPDLWNPGYPVFLATHRGATRSGYVQNYRAQSSAVDGRMVAAVRKAARLRSLVVAFGFSERRGSELYVARHVVDANGRSVLHNRSGDLSAIETSLFTAGDGTAPHVGRTCAGTVALMRRGDDASSIAPTGDGELGHLHLSMLACPLLRAASDDPALGDPHSRTPLTQLRAYARAHRRYVLVSSQVISGAGARVFSETRGRPGTVAQGGGLARVYGVAGEQLSPTLDHSREGLVCADLQ